MQQNNQSSQITLEINSEENSNSEANMDIGSNNISEISISQMSLDSFQNPSIDCLDREFVQCKPLTFDSSVVNPVKFIEGLLGFFLPNEIVLKLIISLASVFKKIILREIRR